MRTIEIVVVVLCLAAIGLVIYSRFRPGFRPLFAYYKINSSSPSRVAPVILQEVGGSKPSKESPDLVKFNEESPGKYSVQNLKGLVMVKHDKEWMWAPKSEVGSDYKLVLTERKKSHPNRFYLLDQSGSSNLLEYYLMWGK